MGMQMANGKRKICTALLCILIAIAMQTILILLFSVLITIRLTSLHKGPVVAH